MTYIRLMERAVGLKMRPEVLEGDVREVLKTLDDESVQCVVTSPPYWGLRDYGTATWEGGDEGCEHTINDGTYDPKKGKVVERPDRSSDKSCCIRCGAKRIDAQLGLEATPEEYVENMVAVFQEVKRVLRKDGTVWLNLGDSYSSGSGGYDDKYMHNSTSGTPSEGVRQSVAPSKPFGLPSKNLLGMPWRVAFALQADGWYLRSDIIWNKPNPMPEPVKDRPTKSHEYIFLLTKSKKYYYDNEAIKEANADPKRTNFTSGSRITKNKDRNDNDIAERDKNMIANGRNKRSVWKITTQSYKEAHFATFPEELPETCIKAGTSKAGCCADCGKVWERITKPEPTGYDGSNYGERAVEATGGAITGGTEKSTLGSSGGTLTTKYRTLGWKPTCDCNADKVPCVVLDIFAGSGTTLRVASKLGRKGIGIELNPEYIKILKKRCNIESVSLEAFV